MNAYDEAAQMCAAKGCLFERELAYFARHGWAIVTPDCVILAEPWDAETVFIWLCVGLGALPKLCHLVPPGTRWLRWGRGMRCVDGEPIVKQYAFERVRALCSTPSTHGRKEKAANSGSPGSHRAAGGASDDLLQRGTERGP